MLLYSITLSDTSLLLVNSFKLDNGLVRVNSTDIRRAISPFGSDDTTTALTDSIAYKVWKWAEQNLQQLEFLSMDYKEPWMALENHFILIKDFISIDSFIQI